MIEFIEKERYYDNLPFTGRCYMYPTYMIKDGKQYFVFNRREPDDEWKIKENDICKQQLILTDGKYFKFNGFYDNPIEMLVEIVKRKHHFTISRDLYDYGISQAGFLDFHSNRKEVSAAFYYRIYDEKLATQIQMIVECINRKKWDDADKLLNGIAQ